MHDTTSTTNVDMLAEMGYCVILGLGVFCMSLAGQGNNRGRLGGGNEDLDFLFELIDEYEDEGLVRSKPPETWLFHTTEIGEQGHVWLRVTFPDSITSWSMQAVGVSSTTGMCVAPASNVTVFREFFLQLDMPYSAIDQEQIEIRATLYNYRDNHLMALVYLEGSEGICYGARAGENTDAIRLTIEPNKAKQVAWPIVPLSTGDFLIRVKAFTNAGADIVEKKLHVVPQGIQKVQTRTIVLDPSGELQLRQGGPPVAGVQNGKQFTIIPLRLPEEHVPGSAHCSVIFTGEIMDHAGRSRIMQVVLDGNTFQNLIRAPTGSGEQTLMGLGPLVYVAKYLKETNQMTGEKENQVYDLIRNGVLHEMTYRKPGGGFAEWPHGSPTSTWLTAFATKIFSQARKFIALATDPSEIICEAVQWMSQQQKDTGSYQDPHTVLQPGMIGGIQGDATFTAYVLIGMLEADSVCQNEAVEQSMNRALRFLESQVPHIVRPYQAAITSYALALADSDRKGEANAKLRELAVYDADKITRHWPADVASLWATKPYWYTRRPSVIEIETAAYAILAQIANDDISYANPIVNWLVAQRNGNGAFISTQDTVIGLQALSEYNIQTRHANLDLQCLITSPNYRYGQFRQEIAVTENNADVKQEVEVTTQIGGEIFIETVGEGVGQIVVELVYNVHDVTGESCPFELIVRYDEFIPNEDDDDDDDDADDDDEYLGAEDTGMTILDVGLFTGFEPITDDLEALKNNDALGVGRYELNDRSVVFYLDMVPTDNPVCLSFTAKRKYVVGLTHAVGISVYDYYEPGEKCTKFYHPEFQSPLLHKMCDSDQCICAEAKCGTCHSFETFNQPPLRYYELYREACSKGKDYVLKVTMEQIEFNIVFEIVTARVEKVIKLGADDIQVGQNITFWKKAACACPFLDEGITYYVMGRDGVQTENEQGEKKFKYMLDEGSYIMEFVDRMQVPRGSVQWLQSRDQHKFQRDLTRRGCGE